MRKKKKGKKPKPQERIVSAFHSKTTISESLRVVYGGQGWERHTTRALVVDGCSQGLAVATSK